MDLCTENKTKNKQKNLWQLNNKMKSKIKMTHIAHPMRMAISKSENEYDKNMESGICTIC